MDQRPKDKSLKHKTLGRKHGEKIHGFGNKLNLLAMIPKAEKTNEKVDNLISSKFKMSVYQRPLSTE